MKNVRAFFHRITNLMAITNWVEINSRDSFGELGGRLRLVVAKLRERDGE